MPDEVPQPSNESSDDSKHDGHRDGYEGVPVALIPDRNAVMEGPQNIPNEAKHLPPRMLAMERSAPRLQRSSGPGVESKRFFGITLSIDAQSRGTMCHKSRIE